MVKAYRLHGFFLEGSMLKTWISFLRRIIVGSFAASALAACASGSTGPTQVAGIPTATPNGTPAAVASITATFATDPHISGTQNAGYTIIGNRPFALTITALDQNGAPITGPNAPTFTVKSASTAIAIAPASATTFTTSVKNFSTTPVQLTVTPSRGNAITFAISTKQELWVANFNAGQGSTVTGYALGTNAPIAEDTLSVSTGAVSAPTALAFDTSGNLWVVNVGNGSITAIAPGSTTPIAADTITTGLGSPFGLAFDTHGTLWVGNASNNTVTAYVPGTNTPIAVDTLTGLNSPAAVAFDANGNLWLANGGNNAILAFAPGTTTQIAADTITTGVSDPLGMAFDANRNLWVSNFNINTVTAYATGTTAPITANTISTGLNKPIGVAFDASGNLWVANNGNNTVTAYVPGTNAPITADTITAGIIGPFGLAFAP
jgi:sugar lactone lactonase YvrE